MVEHARGRETQAAFDLIRKTTAESRTLDLCWAERVLRDAALRDIATAWEGFLNDELADLLGAPALQTGEVFHSRVARTVCTALGLIRLQRNYYVGPAGGRYPLDEVLGLHRHYTPAVVDLMCWAAAMDGSFELAGETIARFAGLQIPGRQIQRVVNEHASAAASWMHRRPADIRTKPVEILNIQTDMTGIPMRKEDLVDIQGKQPDGSAKTRQIKVGCVFTQSRDSAGGYLRDPSSSTYLSAFCDPVEFGKRLYAEALKRGYATALRVVFLGDGADWIWNMATDRFKKAVQIVDFYHACEHLHALVLALEPSDVKAAKLFRHWRSRLKNNGLPGILREVERLRPTLDESKQKILDYETAYFIKHAQRMTYRTFRRQGFFIGSGAVEGACRHVVAQRAKLSGMRWHLAGAENVLTFRSLIKSGLFDVFSAAHRQAA